MGTTKKSTVLSVLLVLFFGGWGLFYSNVKAALIVLFITFAAFGYYLWTVTGGLFTMTPDGIMTSLTSCIGILFLVRIFSLVIAYQSVNDNKYFGMSIGDVIMHILAVLFLICALIAIYSLFIVN